MSVELPFTDQLALDRTVLANRRTWLASARTSLVLLVSGVSFVKFFADEEMIWLLGVVFMLGAAPVLAMGWWHYRGTDAALRERADRRLRELVR